MWCLGDGPSSASGPAIHPANGPRPGGPAGLERIFEIVGSAAEASGRSPQIEALVQHAEITDDAAAAAARLVPHVPGASVDDLLNSPFVWIGTVGEIRERLRAHQDSPGIERYMVREQAISEVALIVTSAKAD